MSIAMTGSSGFLGTHLVNEFEKHKIAVLCSGSRTNWDFTKYEDCVAFLEYSKPKTLIHLAGISGGIGANRARPDEFFHANILLVANMFRAAALNGVKEIIYTFGGCSYPNQATSPIAEDALWDGIPHGDSAAYSMAKKMGVVAASAYKKYGLQSKLLIPGNLYGEYDNYSLENSHVIPAMIRKFYEAKNSNTESVVMWGDGTPTRDFVYAGDVAAAILEIINLDIPEAPINLSSGKSTSIRELAEKIAHHTNYSGEIIWDTSKPNGQQNKIFDTSKALELGIEMNTELSRGIEKTISWFETNYKIPGAVRL